MSENERQPVLWYFADPMCSWCWGFSPVIKRIREQFGDRVRISLNLGGLRPGTREPIGARQREEILHHWQQVNKLTGQQFQFEGAMPDGFIYDTEPPSRATLVVGQLQPGRTQEFFTAVHRAFYLEGKDVTRQPVLAELAAQFGVPPDEFNRLFESDELKQKTLMHFRRTLQAGVRGFPTTVWQDGDQVELLASGYVPYERIAAVIEQLLTQTEAVNG